MKNKFFLQNTHYFILLLRFLNVQNSNIVVWLCTNTLCSSKVDISTYKNVPSVIKKKSSNS